eukprot:2229139-Amphidinium_carterae.1
MVFRLGEGPKCVVRPSSGAGGSVGPDGGHAMQIIVGSSCHASKLLLGPPESPQKTKYQYNR